MKKTGWLLLYLLSGVVSLAAAADRSAIHTPISDEWCLKGTGKVSEARPFFIDPGYQGPGVPDLYTLPEAFPADITNIDEFNKEYLSRIFPTDPVLDSLISTAQSVIEEIYTHKRFIDIIAGRELVTLPVGMRKSFSGNSFVDIGVVHARLHPEYAEVDMFARLQLGELQAELFFAASGVKISRQGGLYEEARLHLVGDVPVIQNGGKWLMTFKGGFRRNGRPSEESYIAIDCEGKIRGLSLATDIRISKAIAVPLRSNGDYAYPEHLEPSSGDDPVGNKSYLGAEFRLQVRSAEDLLFQLDLPLFELRALKGWGFRFKDCVLDLSDTANAGGIKFPGEYTDNGWLIRGRRELWRGFFSKKVEVMLPQEFQLRDTDQRVTLEAENFLIDHHGLSGSFSVGQVIPLEKGTAGGWSFSVDEMNLDLVGNRFRGAGFGGQILLPVSEEGSEKALNYSALISANSEYLLEVMPEEELAFDIFHARANLKEGSYIRMEVVNGNFYPEANLTGVMHFSPLEGESITSWDGEVSPSELELQGLVFQNLRLQTKEAPFIQAEYLALQDTVGVPSLYGFELGVHDIVLEQPEEEEVQLAIHSFVKLDDSGIKGDLALRIVAAARDGDLSRWRYKTTEVDSVTIEVQRKNFEFRGSLGFIHSHDVYGNALSGSLLLYEENLGLEIGARGLFGKADNTHYWYVDGFGVPGDRSNTPFKIHSLSGGLYYHMRRRAGGESLLAPSGIEYLPDADTGLGFKAMVGFEVGQKVTFSGLSGLEMSFNSKAQGGGIRRIGFYGAASLLNAEGGDTAAVWPNLEEVQQAEALKREALASVHQLSIDRQGLAYYAREVFPDLLSGRELFGAQLAIDFDLHNKVYWGLFDTFLNAGALRGDGEKNRLGYLEFYSAPDDWYIWVGTPEKRLGVRDIPVGAFRARANVYFATGTILPEPADPPAEVVNILRLNGEHLEFNSGYTAAGTQGKGVAFGATLAMQAGFDWGLIYAQAEAGAGFDLMMKNFGATGCGSGNGQIGINGWYATGNAYAWMQGSLGVRVDLFFMKMDVPVVHGGLALLVRAQMPNPWYMEGYAGLDFRVLGHIRIRTRLKVVLGEPCEMIERTGVEGMQLIGDIKPGQDAEEVSVFESVRVALNVSEGEQLQLETLEGKRYFRANLDTLVVYEGSKRLKGKISWNTERDLLTWNAEDILPGETEMVLWVRLAFEEYRSGQWQPVTRDGQQVFEEQKVRFTTTSAPSKIPLDNIAFMYPAPEQRYVLPQEYSSGIIQLKKGQDHLFEDGLETRAFLLNSTEEVLREMDFTYDRSNNRIRFSLEELQPSSAYQLIIRSGPPDNGNGSAQVHYTSAGAGVEISGNSVTGEARNTVTTDRLNFSFTTSAYATFKDKIRALSPIAFDTYTDGDHDVAGLSVRLKPSEPWDINEVLPTRYNEGKPILRAVARLNNSYFEKEVNPLLYKEYPLDRNIHVSRDTLQMGLPPVRAVMPSLYYRILLEQDPDNNHLKDHFPLTWRLPKFFKQDFTALQTGIVDRVLNRNVIDPEQFKRYEYLINGKFPWINTEKYEVYLHYILPHRTTGNAIRFHFKNTF